MKLSPRIDTVFKMTLQGHSHNDIAETMRISKNTVKGYRKRLYRYLGVNGKKGLLERFQ